MIQNEIPYFTLPAFIEEVISMPNMKSNNIPWGDPVLAPGTSLSRQQESKQAQRLHPIPPRVSRHVEFTTPRRMILETAATRSNPATKTFCVGHMLGPGTAHTVHPVNCRYLIIFMLVRSQPLR
jgi:hypothetical protein